MVAVSTEKIHKTMESARDLTQGTMELAVLFDTEEEVRIAREWMKGKRKVKTLSVMTHKKSDEEKAKRRKEIAASMGIKE